MKNPKKLTRLQKKFLSSKGYDVKCYLIIKHTPDYLIILNKETGQVQEVWR